MQFTQNKLQITSTQGLGGLLFLVFFFFENLCVQVHFICALKLR